MSLSVSPASLPGFLVVVHGHRLDFHRQTEDLAIDDPRASTSGKKSSIASFVHERRQVLQHAAVVVAEEVARADDEEIGTLAARRTPSAVWCRPCNRYSARRRARPSLALGVPAVDAVLEPLFLALHPPTRSVELPELQRIALRGGGAAADDRQRARPKHPQPTGGAGAGLDQRSPAQPVIQFRFVRAFLVRPDACLAIVESAVIAASPSSRPRDYDSVASSGPA